MLEQGQFWTPSPLHRAWGSTQRIRLAEPAAGRNTIWKPDPAYLWRLRQVFFKLVTNEEAAERLPELTFANADGITFAAAQPNAAQTARLTQTMTWTTAWTAATAVRGTQGVAWMPELTLRSGDEARITVSLLRGTDQISEIVLLADQYEPAREHDLEDLEYAMRRIHRLEEQLHHAHAAPAY